MDDRFFRAWINRRDWRVCGLRMQPLCLGHLVNLHAVKSPLLPEADDIDLVITPGDLLLAARICAESWPFPGTVRPRLRDVIWRWRMERNPRLFRHHLRLFTSYFRDHTSFPEFWRSEETGGRSLSAPEALGKAAYLISHTSISEERAWSMPLARVDYTMAAVIERETGGVRFWHEDDEEDPTVQPDDTLSEEQILAMAREQLPADAFAAFAAARKAKAKGKS
jgi:hypothetical protein